MSNTDQEEMRIPQSCLLNLPWAGLGWHKGKKRYLMLSLKFQLPLPKVKSCLHVINTPFAPCALDWGSSQPALSLKYLLPSPCKSPMLDFFWERENINGHSEKGSIYPQLLTGPFSWWSNLSLALAGSCRPHLCCTQCKLDTAKRLTHWLTD